MYAVRTKSGRVIGRYATRAEAERACRTARSPSAAYDLRDASMLLTDWFAKHKPDYREFGSSDWAVVQKYLEAYRDSTHRAPAPGMHHPQILVSRSEANSLVKALRGRLSRIGKYGGVPAKMADERRMLGDVIEHVAYEFKHPTRIAERSPSNEPFFEVVFHKDGYWIWSNGAYRPLIMTNTQKPAAVIRSAVRKLMGVNKFALRIRTAHEAGRLPSPVRGDYEAMILSEQEENDGEWGGGTGSEKARGPRCQRCDFVFLTPSEMRMHGTTYPCNCRSGRQGSPVRGAARAHLLKIHADVSKKLWAKSPGKKPWEGTSHNESMFSRIQPWLAGIYLDGVEGVRPNSQGRRQVPIDKADEGIARGQEILANALAQNRAPTAESRRWMQHAIRNHRTLLENAIAVRRGVIAPKL